MVNLLMTREALIRLFKKYESIITFLLKLVIGIMVFSFINRIDFADPIFSRFTAIYSQIPFIIMLAISFAMLPITFNFVIIIICIALQLSGSLVVMAFVTLILFAVLFLYARLATAESTLILATLFCFYFKLPVVVPMFAGLYFGMTSIIPISIGVFLWFLIPLVKGTLDGQSTAESLDITALMSDIQHIYTHFFAELSKNDTWFYTALVFSIVLTVVFFVSKLSFNYSKEFSLLFGMITNIFGFLFFVLTANIDIDILGTLISTLVSFLIVYVVSFFDVALNYEKASNVQFEDESYYYYVKVIPKINLTKKRRSAASADHEKPNDDFYEGQNNV